MYLVNRTAAVTIISCSILLASGGSQAAEPAMKAPPVEARGVMGPIRAPMKAAARPMALPASHVDTWQEVAAVRFSEMDTARFIQEDDAQKGTLGVPLRVGVERAIPTGVVNSTDGGTWVDVGESGKVWRLKIEAPGAYGIRIHFSNFNLPDGTVVLLTGDDGEVFTYRAAGPNRNNEFWSHVVNGNVAYLEYQTANPNGMGPVLEISEIAHIYRDLDPEPQPADAQGLLPCHEDVNCHTVDAVAKASVARLLFQDGGSFVCSGGLLNDGDPNTFAGYFLTANHCMSTQAVVNTLQLRWFFQTTSCGGGVSNGFTTLGGTLLETSTATDFTLLRTTDDPDGGQGFAAWTIANPSGTVTGIHHPGGSYKRIAIGFVTTAQPICGGLPLSNFVYNDWNIGEGVTEGGSSGSPLFDSQWRVVGQLFGTCQFSAPGCNNPSAYNNAYGRLSSTFGSIIFFLSGVIPDDVYEDNDTLAQAALIPDGSHDLRLVDFEDYFEFEVCEAGDVVVSANFDTADMDLDLQLLETGGAVLDTSAGSTGVESVSATLGTGFYVVRATKDGGWGGDYNLSIGVPNSYGDVDGNGTVNLVDLFCVLDGFVDDFSTCTLEQMDLEPCGGNGTINLGDLFALLNAMAGQFDCSACE